MASNEKTKKLRRKQEQGQKECHVKASGEKHNSKSNNKRAYDNRQLQELIDDVPSGIAIIEVNPNDAEKTLRTIYYNQRFAGFSGYSSEEYDKLLKDNEMAFLFEEDIPLLLNDTKNICKGDIGNSADTLVRCHTKDGGFKWLLLTGQLSAKSDDGMCTINIAMVDVTQRQEALDNQRISEAMLRLAAETDKRAMVTYNIKQNYCRIESRTLFSAEFGDVFYDVPQSIIDRKIPAAESVEELRDLFVRIKNGNKQLRTSLQLRVGTDKYEWFQCDATTLFDSDEQPDYAILVFHNITEQLVKDAVYKKWQQSIDARSEQSYTLLRWNLSKDEMLDTQSGHLIAPTSPDEGISFNDMVRRYADKSVCPNDRAELMGMFDSTMLLAKFFKGEHFVTLSYREIAENGDTPWRRITVETVEYPNSKDVQAFILFEDIDEDKQAEIAERALAESDPLTGTLNRIAFADKMDAMIGENTNVHCALLIFDLDGFKKLNDTFGHAAGDQALQEVAAVLMSQTRPGDLVCRMGGDEFLVWLKDVPYNAVIEKTAQQMCEHIRKVYSKDVVLSVTAGIAVYPRDGRSYRELYPNADKALYKMKREGKGTYAFFSDAEEKHTEAVEKALSDVKDLQPRTVTPIKPRMLIVDDSEPNRLMLKNIFKGEYSIETARNGSEAIMRLRHFGISISVVLLDLIMPDMDGFAVLRKMQSDPDLQTIPTIVVTSDEGKENLLKAFELGAAEYVTKPIDVDVIRMRVKAVISKAENERLRAQNSYLMLQKNEEMKYHTVLDSTGTVVIEYDWRNHIFIYDNDIKKHLAGTYDRRSLWQIFLVDMVAASTDVKLLQSTLINLANDRSRYRESRLIQLKTARGQRHWFRVNFYKSVDDFGLTMKLVITFNDVHEEVLAREKLIFQATRDELTGLYNRSGFLDKAAEFVSSKAPGYYVMACMDVDKFKVINDQYGMAKGDEVLKHIASTVSKFVASSGVCCRYAADKFAILYPADMKDSNELALNHELVETPSCIPHRLRLRIGRCYINDAAMSVNEAFERASMAVALATGRYETQIVDYDDSMRSDILQEQRIVESMVDALKNGEFEPWLQPQYNHATGALIGAEALVRWRRDGSISTPNEFIPIFERNGFIYEIDKSIWRQVCALQRRWLDEGKDTLPISVNISRHDMFQDGFVNVLKDLIVEYGIPAELLRLEITESAFSASTDVITEIAGQLVAAGFTVEIDDFGSGYSSLNTLKDVPASILKLDMRFFETTENSARGGSIVESIVRMSQWLGMAVIAEGVEDKIQADYLKSIGCYYIQGYYYSKPVPVADYEKLMENSEAEPKLKGLETLVSLDADLFWDPKSMETLIFNSYVGGALIFEMSGEKTELLRANEQYYKELGPLLPPDTPMGKAGINQFLHGSQKELALSVLKSTIKAGREQSCELCLTDGTHKEYIRFVGRLIARTEDRYLFYAVIHNITEQRTLERERAEAAERLSIIMDNVNGGVSAIAIDDDGTSHLIFCNDKYYELYGYTAGDEDPKDVDPMSFIVPEDFRNVMEKIKKLKSDGKPIVIDYGILKRDGSHAQLRVNASLMSMEGYGPIITSVLTDITEQRTLEEQLRAVIDNINGGVTATYIKGDSIEFVFANDKYYEMLGFTKEQYEAEVRSALDLIHPEDRERVEMLFNRAVEQETAYTMEYRIIRRNGAVRHIMCNANVMHMFGIKELVQLTVFNDITLLREVQRKEHDTALQMQTIMENIQGGVTASTLTDDDNVALAFSNEGYYKILGYTRQQYQQEVKNPFDTILPEDRQRVIEITKSTVQQRSSATYEYRCAKRDGTAIWVQTTLAVVSLEGIGDTVLLAITTDISQIRRANEQLRFLNESASEILAQPDSEKAIRDTLKKLLRYFEGERTYIFELRDETSTSDNTYEICAAGVKPEIDNLQAVPYSVQQYWFEAFEHTGFVVIQNVSEIEDDKADMREILAMQDIHSIIVAPLFRDGRLIGYMGVDNPNRGMDEVSQLIGLSDYIAVLMTRRDLLETIKRERMTLKQLMDDTPGGFIRLELFPDKNPTVITVNDGICKMLHMTREQILDTYGNNAYACLVNEDPKTAANMLMSAYKVNSQYTGTCRLQTGDGSSIPVMLFGRFIKGSRGRLFLNAYFSDITEQKSVEQLQSELLENLPTGAALYEFDGAHIKPIHINKHYWTMVGRSALSEEQVSTLELFHPDDRALVVNELKAAIRQNRYSSGIARILCGDGSYKPFSIVTNNIREKNGNYLLYVTFTRMSDDQIAAQNMLPMALSTIVSNTKDMSYIKDSQLRYICVSQSVAKMAGMESPRDLVGKTAADVFDPIFAEQFDKDDRLILQSKKQVLHAMEHIPNGDGSICLASTTKLPILDVGGNAVGVYCISHDITADRERQSQLKLLTDTIPGGLVAYSISKDGIKTVYFNDGFYDYSGYTKDEYVKLTENEPLALMVEEDRPLMRSMLKGFLDAKQNGMTDNCTYRCRTKDGQIRWMNLKAVLSQVDEDSFVLNAVQLDVTESVNAERRQIDLLDNLPFGCAMFEYDGTSLRTIHLNKRYIAMVNRNVDIATTEFSPDDAIHPEDRGRAIGEIRAAIKENRNAGCDIRIRYDKDDYRLFHLDARIEKQSNGKHMLYVAYEPITDKDKQFKETAERLMLLSQSIPGGIATFRCMMGSIEPIYYNDGICDLTGYSREEFQKGHVSVLGLIFDEDRPVIREQIQLLMGGAKSLDYFVRIHTKDGGFKWVQCVASLTGTEGDDAFLVSAVLTDVTEHQEERERLRVSEELNRLAIDQGGKIIGRYDVEERTLTLPGTLPSIFNVPRLLQNMPEEQIELGRISPETADIYRSIFSRVDAGHATGEAVYQQNSSLGWRWLKSRFTTVFGSDGKPNSAVVTFEDITEQRDKEAIYTRWQNAMSERPEESYTLIRCNLNMSNTVDSWEGKLLRSSFTAVERPFNSRTADYADRFVYADDKQAFSAFLNSDTMLAEYHRGHRSDYLEYRENNEDGTVRWLKLTVDLVEYPDSKDVEAYLLFEDVDERKKTELANIQRAETDPLTGILNRSTFADRVNRVTGHYGTGAVHALFVLDVDGFKQVNDVFGHGAGDQALTDIANALSSLSRKDDIVGRLGGDEFFVFFYDIKGKEVAERKARQICDMTRKSLGPNINISTSIGIALSPNDGDSFEALYKTADEALYRTKNAGKDGYSFSVGTPVVRANTNWSSSSTAKAEPAVHKKDRRVLIVDDNSIALMLLENILKNDYTVEKATDGRSALSILNHYGTAISVVLLDLMMPGINGFQVLETMQKNDRLRTIPVIVVSADENRETALSVIKAGASDLVTKPVDADLLRIRVQSAISKADNERLRAQNSYLAVRNTEVNSYRTALERTGTLVILYDRINDQFSYSPTVSTSLDGAFDARSFWDVLRMDKVTDSATVKTMQQLTQDVIDDDERTEDGLRVRLKTTMGIFKPFDFSVFKEPGDFGRVSHIVMTLREAARTGDASKFKSAQRIGDKESL